MPTDAFEPIRSSLLELRELRRMYLGYDVLYEGTLPEYFDNDHLREDLREAGRRYRLNMVRKAVTAPLNRLKIAGIDSVDPVASAVLEQFWHDNELKFDSKVAHEKALVYGNSAIIAMPDAELDNRISAYVHSPESVYVAYRPDKPRQKSHAIHIYDAYGSDDDDLPTSLKYTFVTVYFPDYIERWASTYPIGNATYQYSDWESQEFRLLDELPEPVPGIIPVFQFRTSRDEQGRSQLADVEGCQLSINDTFVAMNSSIRAAGYRQRYLTTEKVGSSGDNFSEAVSDDEQDVDQQRFESGPDTIMHFSGHDVQVGSFDVSQSSNFTEPLDRIVSWMAKITDTPSYAYLDSATPASGVALSRAERPLNDLVAHLQELFSSTWEQLHDYVLQYNGISNVETSVRWAKSVNNDTDTWDINEQKVALGVPNSVVLVESGYTNEEVDEWNVDNTLGGSDLSSVTSAPTELTPEEMMMEVSGEQSTEEL